MEQLKDWTGPYTSELGSYYHHRPSGVSMWADPAEIAEHELAIRHSVLRRCLPGGMRGRPRPAALLCELEEVEEGCSASNCGEHFATPLGHVSWPSSGAGHFAEGMCIDSDTAVPYELFKKLLLAGECARMHGRHQNSIPQLADA